MALTAKECVKVTTEDRLAIITIDHRPVNALNRQTLQELDQVLEAVAADSNIKVVILTGGGSLAFVAGADIKEVGHITSAQEAQAIRRRCGASWLVVCPGIRPAGVAAGDQARVVTPREAVARGADALIIGRPITHARDPRAVVRRIVEDLNERHPCSHETSS